jgi:hypothetical protein
MTLHDLILLSQRIERDRIEIQSRRAAAAAGDTPPQFDSIIELGADDPDYGDPAGWPAWTDDWRWVPTEPQPLEPPADEEPAYEPTPQDRTWSASHLDADEAQAWAEYREWAEHVDRIEAERRALDAQYEARCRFG